MTDQRDEFRPYWPSTVAAFDAPPEPPRSPATMPWQYPLPARLLAAMLDSSKIPIPPAQPPWFPGMPMRIPSIGNIPSWMESAVPPDEGRGILGQLSRRTPPATHGWDPSSPTPWRQLAAASNEFPATAAPPIDDDPFARAALRTRQSVQPPFGRQPGITTALLPAAVEGIATLAQRAMKAAGDLHRTGEYDPAPGVETAMLMAGSPLTPAGALGSAARRPPRLPMDRSSRMQRARELGYADEPFYRGEATGRKPSRFPGGGDFSRDYDTSAGFARRGGSNAPAEYRLNLTKSFNLGQPVTAESYARLVGQLHKTDPKLASEMVDLIAPGRNIDWLMEYATRNPNVIAIENGALVHAMIERGSRDAVGTFIHAGFDAIDSGRDVRKLTGEGIRHKDAAFDPTRAHSSDIFASLLAALGLGSSLGRPESQ